MARRRFYIQARHQESGDLSTIKAKLIQCGRVLRSGPTTVSNPKAGWFEIEVEETDTDRFLTHLANVMDRIEKVIPVSRGQARLLSKQIDLFRQSR